MSITTFFTKLHKKHKGGGNPNITASLSSSPISQIFLSRDFLPMYATHGEIHTFLKHVLCAKKYCEFGAGGSTFLVLYTTLAQVISIESNPAFLADISKNPLIASALLSKEIADNTPKEALTDSINNNADSARDANDKNVFIESADSINTPRLRFFPIDIGAVGEWGIPKDDSKKSSYPLYSQHIFNVLSKEEINAIDTFFIDGRFRVACVFSTLLHCNEQSKIIIHDFFNRPQYHVVLEFLELIERCDTLGVFKPKPNLNKNTLHTYFARYQYEVS